MKQEKSPPKMNRKSGADSRKEEKQARNMRLLLSVRENKPYSKQWRIWASLVVLDLVSVELSDKKSGPNIKSVHLTDWGNVVLDHWLKKQ